MEMSGWRRQAVQLGLHEKRSRIVCLGNYAFCGEKLCEKKHPEVAQAWWKLAASRAQKRSGVSHDPVVTRLTAEEAIKQLRAQGFADGGLPSRSGTSNVLKR
ncbi:MAG: hypothetical protein E6Q43_01325 [Dokdonella sp.]|nr:MAG: hypothetical protein E6Q43_01325 [Dokdonella sp.]